MSYTHVLVIFLSPHTTHSDSLLCNDEECLCVEGHSFTLQHQLHYLHIVTHYYGTMRSVSVLRVTPSLSAPASIPTHSDSLLCNDEKCFCVEGNSLTLQHQLHYLHIVTHYYVTMRTCLCVEGHSFTLQHQLHYLLIVTHYYVTMRTCLCVEGHSFTLQHHFTTYS